MIRMHELETKRCKIKSTRQLNSGVSEQVSASVRNYERERDRYLYIGENGAKAKKPRPPHAKKRVDKGAVADNIGSVLGINHLKRLFFSSSWQ